MSTVYDSFERKHDYLVCVDSDGCAMDTMDIKHFRCFGPCMVAEWGLEQWKDEILERWNVINLYSMTRGINRFKGLAQALGEINEKYTPIEDISVLQAWVVSGAAPSNPACKKAYEETGSIIMKKALAWSEAVNANIRLLPEEVKKPFEGAKEGLAAAHEVADVAIVSSANRDAVMEEWTKWKLLDSVDIVLAQDCGSKAECIAEMLKFGYAQDHVLMVGDAPGDRDAATKNGVYYYPIQVRKEKASWDEFVATGLGKLTSGEYADYETVKIREFLENLGG